ncbi:MAG TPA: protoporphyrinogen oxidase, partial [Vicinamibacterales bacterium]
MIAIVGAGITGLAAAYELASRGVPFRVIEAASRPGGLILTEHASGFTIEAGPDSVLAQKPAALALCDELGLAPRIIPTTPPRTAFVLKAGRLFPLPSPSVLGIPLTARAIARYDLLPRTARVRLLMEPFVSASNAPDESVGRFFRRRFGRATVDLIADPLLGGIHAGDINALSVRSLFPRFAEAEARDGSVLRAFAHSQRAGGEGLFRSLSSGMGELVSAIERRLPDASIQYDSPVERLVRQGSTWRVAAGGVVTDARAVILAAPAPVAARLLAPHDDRAA